MLSTTLHKEQFEGQLTGLIVGKSPNIKIYMDYENIHYGLLNMGLEPDPELIINAVEKAVMDLGNVTEINAYGDWANIHCPEKTKDVQRCLALRGARPHYQVSKKHKNSSDVRIIADALLCIVRDPNAPDAADIIVFVTGDSDLSPAVSTAIACGKRVVVAGIRKDMSQDLKNLCEVRFLDKYLFHSPEARNYHSATRAQFAVLMVIAKFLRCNRWKWVSVEKVNDVIAQAGQGEVALDDLISTGMLVQGRHPATFALNMEHPDAFQAWWIVDRLQYLIREQKMPYVDTAFLARGMELDNRCQQIGVGQTRHDAEQMLKQAEKSGWIYKEMRKHPKDSGKVIETWWPSW